MPDAPPPAEHAFRERPHRTLAALSVPVMLSMIAEPLTGLVDTAFVARLGADPAAALGVGTVVLSGVLWVFNFLSIGCQTEVARATGRNDPNRARQVTGLALVLAAACGLLLIALGEPASPWVATLMEAEGEAHGGAVSYLRIRLLASPAVLVTAVTFGALRGVQDMRTPLWIATFVNGLNILLDVWWIPQFGIAGAAWATVASQGLGAVWGVLAVLRRLGVPRTLDWSDVRQFVIVGRDLFVRTGLLFLFLGLTTRAATDTSANAGGAHQAIRQFWTFTAFLLDGYAVAAQSLVGYFLGVGAAREARRVAAIACAWACGTGTVLAAVMLALEARVESLLVPAAAASEFRAAWWITALFQPLNAISFATDGVHWGARDYRWLRNAMIVATGTCGALLLVLQPGLPGIWWVTGLWIAIRATCGFVRVWPGRGGPLGVVPGNNPG